MGQQKSILLDSKQSLDYIHYHNGDHLPSIVLLHGYGASMHDLAPLATISPTCKNFNWYFPDGILEVLIGPMMTGRAWFPIDINRFNQAAGQGTNEKLYSESMPKGLEEATKVVKEFNEKVIPSTHPIILGGFSQGSMLATNLSFYNHININALILLSSTLVARDKLQECISNNNFSFPIFQSHGTSDSILPFHLALQLKLLLEAGGFDIDFHEFPGGHEIPPLILNHMLNFLEERKINI